MRSLYERVTATLKGARAVAAARLRHEVLALLHQAQLASRMTQSDVARELGVRRSAANQVFRGDGNIRTNTLAEYLHAMGFEADLRLVRAGEPRQAALEQRAVRPAFEDWRIRRPQPTTSGVFVTNEGDDRPVLVRWAATGRTESFRVEAEVTTLPAANSFTPLGKRMFTT
ncbi:helix-turn-helix domain-containing protein [Sphaerimonospora thailandensis]|uniref:HTH cro/C1-type domain-containing protein n=1 Tax=Sphaerimonospora thailandensis TaxID=795644 RepID=A0A8J3W169_9ACTN|nr:helix-turn-helix transcriptional regulator [Sphaerimonospora thailandensis]GIH71885.1 hypothetical protein Mth01_41380 [Sphaerimonospora thailandensis]